MASGIVSDDSEEDFDDSDEEFWHFKEENCFNWRNESNRIGATWKYAKSIQLALEWGKRRILVKWRGRSWNWATLAAVRLTWTRSRPQKSGKFRQKINEERAENEGRISASFETMRFNLLEKVVERVIARTLLGSGKILLVQMAGAGIQWKYFRNGRWALGILRGCQRQNGQFFVEAVQTGKAAAVKSGTEPFVDTRNSLIFSQRIWLLRDYQLDGLNWLLQLVSGSMWFLADEMGLGKTIQSVVFPLRRLKPITVLRSDPPGCPAEYNWCLAAGIWSVGGKGSMWSFYMGDAESRATARKYEFPGGFDVLWQLMNLSSRIKQSWRQFSRKLLPCRRGSQTEEFIKSALWCFVFPWCLQVAVSWSPGRPSKFPWASCGCLLRFWCLKSLATTTIPLQKYSVDMSNEFTRGSVRMRVWKNFTRQLPHILRRLKRDVEHPLPGKTGENYPCRLDALQKQLYRYIWREITATWNGTRSCRQPRLSVGSSTFWVN